METFIRTITPAQETIVEKLEYVPRFPDHRAWTVVSTADTFVGLTRPMAFALYRAEQFAGHLPTMFHRGVRVAVS